MTLLFFALAAVAGVLQSLHLRRSARGTPGPFAVLLRLGLVAGALAVAAVNGHILAAAAGWSLAFLLSGALIVWRWS
jgi:hypothetical protein